MIEKQTRKLTKIDSQSEDAGMKNRQETRIKQTCKLRMQAQKIDKRLNKKRVAKQGCSHWKHNRKNPFPVTGTNPLVV